MMSFNRRAFLKLLLASAGTIMLPELLAACRSSQPARPTSPPANLATPAPSATLAATGTPGAPHPATSTSAVTPEANPTAGSTPERTATPSSPEALATQNPKHLFAWLRMAAANDLPSSEADYRAHSSLIDVVMPLNGGTLANDGTWGQQDSRVNNPWAQALPGLAHKAGQLYMPGIGNDTDIGGLLNNIDRQQQAADALVKLAKSGRFDSPWDGVYLDIEGIGIEYRTQMTGFLFRLSKALKAAGLLLGVSVGGVTQETTGTATGDDAMDLGVAGEVADFVDLRCYDYGGPAPRSIAPYWWIEQCVQYALNQKNVPPDKMTVGLATFSQYWPDPNDASSEQMTYDQAVQMAKQSGSSPQWLESDETGLERQSFAKAGNGILCFSDENSYRYGLQLIDQYKLQGNTMFTPGLGPEAQWPVISTWEKARG